MDNLTHSLVGLALASGLKRRTRGRALTLVVAANLPDLDGLSYLFGDRLDGLAFRRGWTHGVLAMVVLPLLLAALVWTGQRWSSRESDRMHGKELLLLAALGVWSHPLLDLLNTYGVRLLMPFSSHWFYGDALFIVDPWVWLCLGSGILVERVLQARSRPARARQAAGWSLALAAGYAVVQVVAGRVSADFVARGTGAAPGQRILAAPVFANPFRRTVIRDLGDRYELGRLSLLPAMRYEATAEISKGLSEAGDVGNTLTGKRFLRWSRFPVFAVEPGSGGRRVQISDLRYSRPGQPSWAGVTVQLR